MRGSPSNLNFPGIRVINSKRNPAFIRGLTNCVTSKTNRKKQKYVILTISWWRGRGGDQPLSGSAYVMSLYNEAPGQKEQSWMEELETSLQK